MVKQVLIQSSKLQNKSKKTRQWESKTLKRERSKWKLERENEVKSLKDK